MGLKTKIKSAISFWPWTKENKAKRKKISEVSKTEEMLELYIKHIPRIREIMSKENPNADDTDGQIIGRMYDFYKDAEELTGDFWSNDATNNFVRPNDFNNENLAANGLTVPDELINPKDKRKVAKPIDVQNELETVPTPFTLEGLDEKIALFKDKKSISVQKYAKDQIQGFLKRLENRKKYKKNIEFFSQFPNTTDDKIDELLSNYKLVMEESELFIPTFPKEAVDVMKKYSDVCEKEFGEKPVFYVIAEEKDFKKKREKLDPILLAQSPFGFYWNVLGAWDREMLLLHEL